jgi:glycosyltransferase involved in cell wall biosynthesis
MKIQHNLRDEPKISAIIPTYNRGYCISRALKSIEDQTQPVHEILVVDDGSTDDTQKIVNRQHPAVQIITNPTNRGVSNARNLGIKRATGTHLAFLDSDDTWSPTKIERQLHFCRREPTININHCDELWIKNGERINQKFYHRKFGGDLFERSLLRCMISPSSVMIKKTLFTKYGDFDEDLPACEDYDLWLRITAQEIVGYIDSPLVTKYGGHADQLSKAIPALDRYRIHAIKKLIDQGGLKQAHLESAISVLKTKLEIYLKGAIRRGNSRDVSHYESIRRRYTK